MCARECVCASKRTCVVSPNLATTYTHTGMDTNKDTTRTHKYNDRAHAQARLRKRTHVFFRFYVFKHRDLFAAVDACLEVNKLATNLVQVDRLCSGCRVVCVYVCVCACV